MPIETATDETTGSWLIENYLTEQQAPTAVETFARQHESDALPAQAKYYRDLIPATAPGTDEQYAFEIDLDACSGCKACVTACHSLNGLEEDELWRSVGMLHGGTTELPVLQHVTTACHHCIDPACLSGCPVNAYEKDPITGIVKHLDDQCIGCQYCILKCPYDVPQYSASKGIVRKCDMCQDRLADGEAPACVQSCPNQAIRIEIVDTRTVLEESEANRFLPGAPEPGYTIPTTSYKTEKSMPRNLLPADYYSSRPQHAHLPLVFMLVLTQMSVGAFVVEQMLMLSSSWLGDELLAAARPVHLVAALLLGLLGLGAAVLHLGRPLYAFRSILGLRHSWLSREILAFGLFFAAASAYVAAAGASYTRFAVSPMVEGVLGAVAAITGLAAIFCSIMIYVDTRRPFWSGPLTSIKFFLTAAVLGIPTALFILLVAAAFFEELTVKGVMAECGLTMCRILAIAVTLKLACEATIFLHLRQQQHTPRKRTAQLLTGELGMATVKRFFFGIIGGIVLPLVLLGEESLARDGGFHALFIGFAVFLVIGLLTVGELMERYLFFRAVVAHKMPGAAVT